MKKSLRHQRIDKSEILPNVWMIGGYISSNFFMKPPSSNIYILLDEGVIYLIDTGNHKENCQRTKEIG